MTSIPEWLKTHHPREVIEAAPAHVVRNWVEAAFARSDPFERRRVLIDDWARCLGRASGKDLEPLVQNDLRDLRPALRLAR